jgi:hypothetical protein
MRVMFKYNNDLDPLEKIKANVIPVRFMFLLLLLFLYDIPCRSQEPKDSVQGQENFIFSLFPEDCMAIYRLSFNYALKRRLDSIRNKFSVYSITVRKRSGLANMIFEKLSESLLPDSMRYIAFRVNFKYEGKNLAYSLSTEGGMNCDTLKSIFTIPVIQRISESVLLPNLASKTFNQPIAENSIQIFNSALFPSIDSLLAIYNNDRIQNLASEIEKYLVKTEDTLNGESNSLKARFAIAREKLVKLIQLHGMDSALYFGNQSQYTKEGMSKLFLENSDSTGSYNLSEVDNQIDTMIYIDKKVLHINCLRDNIDFLRKYALYPFSHKIKIEIETKNFDVNDLLISENRTLLFGIVKKYYEKYTLPQLKLTLTDKS